MLVVNYNGNKPITDYFKFSVQGNNKADRIRFLVSLNQNGLVFDENYHYYAKVQNEDDDFYDKVELHELEFDDSENLLRADFILESKHTTHRYIEVSLCCENLNDEIVWQTQLIKVAISNGVYADDEIESKYPTILEQLQKQIDELKQGGGGGGASEVEIKRVWLSYEGEGVFIRSDYLGLSPNKNYVNDSTKIKVNFETTPINAQMEEEIKNGRFVIRLDYPIKSKSKGYIDKDTRRFLFRNKETHSGGMGVRSYTHTFNDMGGLKHDILLNTLIFVNESDIKVNRYGEKYIHKKVSYFDYAKNMLYIREEQNTKTFIPITNEWINDDNDNAGRTFFEDNIDNIRYNGIPSLRQLQNQDGEWQTFQSRWYNKMYMNESNFSGSYEDENLSIGKKLNPAFSMYCPLGLKMADYDDDLYLFSPYYITKPSSFKMFRYKYGGLPNIYHLVFIKRSGEIARKTGSKKLYMSAKPRCAILNDDYENAEYAFLRTYPQADQQINLYTKMFAFFEGYEPINTIAIFRMLITQK